MSIFDIRVTNVTRTRSPGRHRPDMALTWAMVAKIAEQSPSADIASLPAKNSPRYRYPSSSSSSSPSSSFSIPRTPAPMNLVSDFSSSDSFVSKFESFMQYVSYKFEDVYFKIEDISIRMHNIEECITDQRFIVNELERELSVIAGRLKKISLSSPQPNKSSSQSIDKGTQTSPDYSLTSFPHVISPSHTKPRSLPIPQLPCPVPATRSATPADGIPPIRPTTYWRSVPSTQRSPSRSADSRKPASKSMPRSIPPSRSAAPSPTSDIPRNLTCPTRPTPTRNPSTRNQRPLHIYRVFSSSYSNTIFERQTRASKPSLLILGDSNTKHIKLSGAYNITRVPTFLIQDINPSHCRGHDRVWLHVGTNNLKYSRCSTHSDVKRIFTIFMNKLSAIRDLCPNTKVFVSPILPSGIPGFNTRASWFNRMLFSVKNIWWSELGFRGVCSRDTGLLETHLRPYRNRSDKFHLGMKGIIALENSLLSVMNKVDHRFYSDVVKNRAP